MDGIESIANGLVASSVSASLNIGLLKSVDNLSEIQSAVLFSSIGIGGHIDAYA